MMPRRYSWKEKYVLLPAFMICCLLYYFNSHSEVSEGSVKALPNIKDFDLPFTPTINSTWQELLCAQKNLSLVFQEGFHALPKLHRDIEPNITTDNIFLTETSCNPSPNYRSWCSLESWAKLYPEKNVWYYMTSPYENSPVGMWKTITDHYKNVRLVDGNMDETFRDVPLWDLFKSNRWIKQSAYPANKLSNFLRLILLYKYGGIYSDTDAFAIRRVPKDLVNAVGLQSEDVVNGALILSQSKNPVLWDLMEDITRTFNGYTWGTDGPHLMTRGMKKVCNMNGWRKYVKTGITCGNITVLPTSSFYPIPYEEHALYTNEHNEAIDIHEKFESTYVLHFWNAFTKKARIRFGGHSFLDLAAKTSCPITYETARSLSSFF